MASTMLPFLYQTRTLQRLARAQIPRHFSKTTRAAARRQTPSYDAIPFEGPIEGVGDDAKGFAESSTMTPSEAEVFKSIFDDISRGNMPRPNALRKKILEQNEATSGSAAGSMISGSLVEQARQARLSDFRENVLQRFPATLRRAAEKALNLYEFEPSNSLSQGGNLLDLAEQNLKLRQERAECDRKREIEIQRLNELMHRCQTDAELWKVLEDHVFVLPAKLGIAEDGANAKSTKSRQRKPKVKSPGDLESTTGSESKPEGKYSMDVYGPLYSQILLKALDQFDIAFPHPSLYSFNILPKVKSIGLSSYVLGVSTAFYNRLARMHWERYGDANSALAMVEEMNSIGLQPDFMVHELLVRIRDELYACASGSQGPFVAAMMESPPYDAAFLQRLEDMEEYARQSLMDVRGDFSA
ncbi:hypothetical protein NLU13_6700 [Sarocladium strictum]|uniref:Mtf2-like C-terminal domain-containing protein n=1 Tax=Sarocladium strictum TaxID=5046 RepID=A0AA39L693_SARSR|nr:hypothetical protein NLU13_6700 [Sarocladium strictum]